MAENIATFTERLVAACSEMPNPPLDSKNPHFGNKFASLGAVSDSVRPALAKWGLAYRQSMEEVGQSHYVFTFVFGIDSDGTDCEKVMATVPVTVDPNPQKQGSALTYAKRYCLLAAFGLVGDEDEDGEIASKPSKKAAPKAKKPTPTDAEKAELAEIAKALGGDKGAVWAAYQANGIEGARALVVANPTQVELFDADQEF